MSITTGYAVDTFGTEHKIGDRVWITERTRRPARGTKLTVSYQITETRRPNTGVTIGDPDGGTSTHRDLGRHVVTGETTDDLTGAPVYLVDIDS